MLQLSPCAADPAGTRPSTLGSLCDPGPHLATGVALKGGSFGCWIGARAGESPPAWPRAKRSFRGFGAPIATAAAARAGVALSALRSSRRRCDLRVRGDLVLPCVLFPISSAADDTRPRVWASREFLRVL